jgi:DNA-binding NarL/FixJ family response regulator
MDILLIEDNDHRRTTLLKDLLGRGHRVTPSSSIDEAREILQFVSSDETPADVVVVGHELMTEDGFEFRQELHRKFASTRCVVLPADRSAAWLADRLGQLADDGLDVLLIEADDSRRAAMAAHMTDRGDQVRACNSVAEAEDALAKAEHAPDVIVSDMNLSDGNGLSFYLAASRRFPEIRWIITTEPNFLPVPA